MVVVGTEFYGGENSAFRRPQPARLPGLKSRFRVEGRLLTRFACRNYKYFFLLLVYTNIDLWLHCSVGDRISSALVFLSAPSCRCRRRASNRSRRRRSSDSSRRGSTALAVAAEGVEQPTYGIRNPRAIPAGRCICHRWQSSKM